MIKKINALAARKNLGRLLEEAFYRGDEFIIERAGKPMAVLIPIQEFQRWRAQREKDFAVLDEIRARAEAKPQDVEREVNEAIGEIRKKKAD